MRLAAALLTLLLASTLQAAEFRAVRAIHPPTIDGDLSDEAWKSAPEITTFTQHEPDDGKPATQPTSVRVVYDDQAIYFAGKFDDSNKVTTMLGRRDNNFESDWFRIFIDAQNDKLSGAEFWVNPSNVQVDGVIYNDIYDDWSWDAVWESSAKIVPGGWVAEVRIPYSQLRFPDRPVHTWGFNVARKIFARQEVSWVVNTPKGEQGLASRFASLTGIEGIHPSRALEIMPYAVGRSDVDTGVSTADPLNRRSSYRATGGLDIKYSLTSSLRLTGTINPDFGQVEVDPAVINLSEFETSYPEKRPFFTEGANNFSFGEGPANFRVNFNFSMPRMFYSRRIGRSPQGMGAIDADYLDSPTETTILGAAKLTGKVGKGWTVGVLDAVTAAEHARFALTPESAQARGTTNLRGRQTVEPMTNYFVARATKEIGKTGRVGFLMTNVKRDLPSELSFLRGEARMFGVDGYKKFAKDAWLWEFMAAGTDVLGTREAIASTQRNSAHYYNRPDADYLHYDPTRTSLQGWGGRTMIGKQTGKWRANAQFAAWSPGFETNDAGFMPRADGILSHVTLQYVNEDTTKRFREKSWWVSKYQNWNFGNDITANGLYGNWYLMRKNYWYGFGWAGVNGRSMDDRKTRGGPLAERASNYNFGVGAGSDNRKKIYFEGEVEAYRAKDSSWEQGGRITASYRPGKNLKLTIGPSFYRSYSDSLFVAKIVDPSAVNTFGTRYVFGGVDQRTFEFITRADWTVSSRLSFQVFLQPFIATGDYSKFRALARPKSRDYAPYAYAGNPDFSFRSVRGSAVARWEFRPGSALYVVWNENRADTLPLGDFRLSRDVSGLRAAPSKDVFLVKVSYWLPM